VVVISPCSAPRSLLANASYHLPWEVIARQTEEREENTLLNQPTQNKIDIPDNRSVLEYLDSLEANDEGLLDLWLVQLQPEEKHRGFSPRADVVGGESHEDISFFEYIDSEMRSDSVSTAGQVPVGGTNIEVNSTNTDHSINSTSREGEPCPGLVVEDWANGATPENSGPEKDNGNKIHSPMPFV
jgi:hypothetical protein